MKRLAQCRLFLGFLAAALPAFALPDGVKAEYQVTVAGVVVGRVQESFLRKGDTYAIQSITRSEGPLKLFVDDTVTLESQGRIGPGGLQPLEFGQRRAGDSSRDIRATFDWAKGVILSRYKGETREIALPQRTQDRLSVMYQFMTIEAQPKTIELNMSNGRKVDLYTYRLVEKVRLDTPAGAFDTLHYERVTANDRESRADVWLAPDRMNLPVRVVFDDHKGLKLEQTLTQLQVR